MESEEMPEEFLSDTEDDTEDDGAERDAGRKPKRERHANQMKSFEREYSPFREDREFLEILSLPEVRAVQITLKTILALHKGVLGRHWAAGTLRTCNVTVGDFTPMDHSKVPAAMDEYVEWLSANMESEVPAGEFAARAQHKFVYIHPFVDGNGRTSRLIMNFIMERRGFMPVQIPEERREDYYAGLEEATDNNNLVPFINFICYHQQCSQEPTISTM